MARDPIDVAAALYTGGEQNQFTVTRHLNGNGYRRPDGRPWTAVTVEQALRGRRITVGKDES